MNSYKKQKILFSVLSAFIFLIVLSLLIIMSTAEKGKNSVMSNEDFVKIGLKISFLPPDSEPSKAFFSMIDDEKISKKDYQKLENMINLYLSDQGIKNQKIDTSNMSELDKAKANLKAFDEVGYLIVPEEKIKDARNEMLKNIENLEKAVK